MVRRKGEKSDAGKGKNQTPSQPDFPEQCDACDAVCVLVVTLQRLTHKNQALATPLLEKTLLLADEVHHPLIADASSYWRMLRVVS